eukprot:CAMPEP_0197438328 /NCGR_PEP_ID=MMETSP1175-20131217/5359_1 /TAXON_ID=1003142 /ORGANISM="Triceratium dubium, Strain CCMP147" /LENGTH=40 /DNA_ID= /DNA_START= /DNA_END= /DNA_ORIENTATION=
MTKNNTNRTSLDGREKGNYAMTKNNMGGATSRAAPHHCTE